MAKVKKKFYIFGSGGHAKSCIDVIESFKLNKISAIIYKDKKPSDSFFSNYNLVNENELLLSYKNLNAIVGIGQIKSNLHRKKIYKLIKKKYFKIEPIISKNAYVSKTSKINKGTIIMHNSYIGPDSLIGENCIINTGAIIEHDVRIGNHCHISTGCKINGNVKVSNDCFIGSGTIIKEGVKIKPETIIPMGSIVKKDV